MWRVVKTLIIELRFYIVQQFQFKIITWGFNLPPTTQRESENFYRLFKLQSIKTPPSDPFHLSAVHHFTQIENYHGTLGILDMEIGNINLKYFL